MRLTTISAAAATMLLLAGCSTGTPSVPQTSSAPPSASATSAPAELVPERRDVDYVGDATKAHQLDVFLPQGQGNGPFPLVIWVHGGGWAAGDKSDIGRDEDIKMNDTKKLLLAKGYAVAAPNYRTLPDTKFPEPMQDVAASVRFLRAHAGEFGLDTNRFALMGDSAGAHLGAMTAMTPKNAELQGTLGQGGDASVKAFVGYYGIYDLTKRTEDQKAQCGGGKPGAESSHGRLIGADPDSPEGEPVAAKASPVTYVAPDSPPTLLFQGKQDCTAPPMQAERYHAALKQAGVATELTELDKSHGDQQFFTDPAVHEQLIRFLDAHVKG